MQGEVGGHWRSLLAPSITVGREWSEAPRTGQGWGQKGLRGARVVPPFSRPPPPRPARVAPVMGALDAPARGGGGGSEIPQHISLKMSAMRSMFDVYTIGNFFEFLFSVGPLCSPISEPRLVPRPPLYKGSVTGAPSHRHPPQ